MDLSARLAEALDFQTAFTVTVAGHSVPITETVVVSWAVMGFLIVASVLLTRNLKDIPVRGQVWLEAFVGFLDSFGEEQLGHRKKTFVPYLGSLFLFLIVSNMVGLFSPIAIFGFEPPFELKPPTRDINVAAACAVMSIVIVLVSGLRARGPIGWLKGLAHPVPMMLPFNILEYIIRPLSLCLRLFGNILGAFIIMVLIESIAPLFLPPVFSLYFDFFDGFIQALVFTFLTTLFIAEAIE